MIERQYIQQFKKGDSVQYKNKMHRIQEDHGWLFIQVSELGKRKKIGLDKICLFEYGSYQDWIFNEWWRQYPDYGIFKQFAEHEKAILN
jgi:hypothetical protein